MNFKELESITHLNFSGIILKAKFIRREPNGLGLIFVRPTFLLINESQKYPRNGFIDLNKYLKM